MGVLGNVVQCFTQTGQDLTTHVTVDVTDAHDGHFCLDSRALTPTRDDILDNDGEWTARPLA